MSFKNNSGSSVAIILVARPLLADRLMDVMSWMTTFVYAYVLSNAVPAVITASGVYSGSFRFLCTQSF